MIQEQKRIRAVFYRTASGSEPVRQWLKELNPEDRKLIGDDLRTLDSAGLLVCRFAGP